MNTPPPVYTDEEKARERARRAAVRAALLDALPPPDAAVQGDHGSFRVELWPPRPERPADVAPPRDRWGHANPEGTWDAAKLVRLIETFAAARGPDFSKEEFLRWALLGCGTVNRYCGSWRAARVAAGLPPTPARRDRTTETLHRLLRTLHLNRARRTPLTADALARAAGVGRGPIERLGGVKHLRNLSHLWSARPAPPAGAAGVSPEPPAA
ncbi:hypothetical protein [Alienimonas californiensis]|uniref:Uncharacterized protein n=1 Tax=Alienimonas californiensis TaxID=2527989 RepID=A0A517P668_9PLAN|nr:hypothetical protein [Alienimonas californiensis]QDT14881.1 hypothetical protein CA12_09610 [Alienimonas californiensis]